MKYDSKEVLEKVRGKRSWAIQFLNWLDGEAVRDIPEVGSRFDEEAYARAFRAERVRAIKEWIGYCFFAVLLPLVIWLFFAATF